MRSNSRPRASCDRLAEAGLADPGRADEAEDRSRRLGVQLADREVLEDPVLDLLEVVVVLVEHLARVIDVEVVLGLLVPGQLDQPLEVGADDPVLGGRRAAASRAGAARARRPSAPPPGGSASSIRLRRSATSACSSSPSPSSSWIAFICSRSMYSRWPLSSSDWTCGLDLGPELDHLQLAGEDLGQPPQALRDVDLLEQLLLLLGRDPQRAGDQVAERRGLVHVRDRELKLLGQIRDLLDDLARRCSGRCGSAPAARASPRSHRASPRSGRRDTDPRRRSR